MELLKDFYTVKEAAELLNVLPAAVRRVITNGKLKAEKLNGAFIIKKNDLEDYVKNKARG